MHIEEFSLERLQSRWENTVRYNLTESGIHPFTLRELLAPEELDRLLDIRMGYGWTNGDPALRAAIAAHYLGKGADDVLVTSGSSEANFVAAWTLIEPGDEVVMMLPNYMQIWGHARSMGAVVKPFHLKEDRDWAPDLDEVRGLVTSRTKLIAVCNPNNPTGAMLSLEAMRTLIEIADEAGAVLYADEVYRGAELVGPEGPSFCDLSERAVVACGLSKAFSHPGLRIGWLVGPAEFLDAAVRHKDYTTITTAPLAEYVATLVLEPERRRRIRERNRGILNENLALLRDWVDSRGSLFTWTPPEAGGMAFLKYALEMNSSELATWLRKEKSLLVLPGDVYGMDRYVRLGIGGEAAHLAEALALFGQGLDELAASPRSLA